MPVVKRRWLSLVLLAFVASLAPLAGAPPAFAPSAITQPLVRKSAEAITAAELKDYLSFVASDEMEGRLTPSRGLDTTARFIATVLSREGVTPAGDAGSYFQKIALRKEKVVPEGTEVELGGRRFAPGRDFIARAPAGSVTGTMIFAGDGWLLKFKNIDPYVGLDPKGKIVVYTQPAGLPAGVTTEELIKAKRGEDWMDPRAYAEKRGAAAVIVLNSLLRQADPDAMDAMRRSAETGNFYPEKLESEAPGPMPVITANYPLAAAIFAGEKTNVRAILTSVPDGTSPRSFALASDKKIRITIKTSIEKLDSQNVVAVVPGSDPALKAEYVALGAHYDHLGTGAPINGDAIRNGADDDGTGTVALLAIADALMKAPRHPKRSVLFVWHMGEEEGLWGSTYFTAYPTVPLDKVVAQLNIDMIGRSKAPGDTVPADIDLSGPNELYVIGSKMMSTELGELSEAVNDAFLKLSFNYKYDDPKDPEQFFYRSDHINYARKGIPIIFYFTGVHADYHQPSDEVSKIDFPKYEKVTRTVYATLWEIAEMKARLKVDKKLPAGAP